MKRKLKPITAKIMNMIIPVEIDETSQRKMLEVVK